MDIDFATLDSDTRYKLHYCHFQAKPHVAGASPGEMLPSGAAGAAPGARDHAG